jgi:UDP-N-acetylmuramoylalanine--D-glutamate ligase
MIALNHQHVLILGLGDSGLAMARWCIRHQAQVTVADNRPHPPQLEQLKQQCPQAKFIHTDFTANLIEGQDVRAVFKSPGLSPQQVLPVWQAAQNAGLWVGTELSLFSQALIDLSQQQSYHPQVLAITGTNGKTTVTSLTANLLQRAGKTVAVAGNIGPSLLDTLGQCLDQQLPEVWVLELSSFQLYSAGEFEPTAATVLNITQDHLDWHGDMAAYISAKEAVFGSKALMVVNRDDPLVMSLLPKEEEIRKKIKSARISTGFGADLPDRAGDYGLETVNGMTWLVRALEADETRKRKRDEVEEIHIQRLMPADALRIRGRHNALNALAALALACSTGATLAPMLYGLREYCGEPHRLESVAILNQIEYFDDSKGTNVGATVAAINGLGAERKLVVILGGEGKGQDFSPLCESIDHYARAVVLMGRDAPQISKQLSECKVPQHQAGDLEEAVRWAQSQAQAGDAVVLSPACASFDMFRNYEHRAEVFRQIVHDLMQEGGNA